MRDFLMTLLIGSVTMSALALLYMAATPLLARRYSAQSRYYGWLVVVIGLIVPFRPRLGTPLLRTAPPSGGGGTAIQLGTGALAAAPAGGALPAAAPPIPWWALGAAVWLAGALVVLAYYAVKHARFLKLTARWSEPAAGRAPALLRALREQMGISRQIGLEDCACVGSPMLVGFARPRILLPKTDFTEEELRFILTHELVHYRRRDLWYKCLLLLAAALHWFNPAVHLMARTINAQCELSCDEAVVRSAGAGTRLSYSEAIIGVAKYKSRLKTALSTNFYGGKKDMKARIFSIMDMRKKRAGAAVVCGMLLLTVGTGFALPAKAQAPNPSLATGGGAAVTPWISVAMIPDPDTYAGYAPFGISISEDGARLLYNGQPVRLFADEGADGEAFYLNGAGRVNLSAVRNTAGALTGVEEISAQKAQEYQDAFFAEELSGPAPMAAENVTAQDTARVGPDKYGQYRPFGVTGSPADEGIYYNGQRVKCLVDRAVDGWFYTLWTDDAGTVNLAAVRDASGQLTGVVRITQEQAREYQAAAAGQGENVPDGLEERVAAGIAARYGQD